MCYPIRYRSFCNTSICSDCAPTPLQFGVAAALSSPDVDKQFQGVLEIFQENLSLLRASLEKLKLVTNDPEGGYFLIADVSGTGMTDIEFMKHIASKERGVICVPMSAFYDPENKHIPNNLVRFSICKTPETVKKAVEALLDSQDQ